MTGGVVANMFTNDSGATRTTNFTVLNVDVSEAGQYRCRATVVYMGTNDQYVNDPPATDSQTGTVTLLSKHNR